jgi:hypothetical protein
MQASNGGGTVLALRDAPSSQDTCSNAEVGLDGFAVNLVQLSAKQESVTMVGLT